MKLKAIALFILFSGMAIAQNGKIQVEITNIKNAKGNIGLAVYNNAKDFTKKEFKAQNVKAQKGKVYATFENVPAGTYAIAVLHDENKNEKMDFNMVGIPKEAYGFSNNAKGFMAAPKFEAAAFRVKNGESKVVRIKL